MTGRQRLRSQLVAGWTVLGLFAAGGLPVGANWIKSLFVNGFPISDVLLDAAVSLQRWNLRKRARSLLRCGGCTSCLR